MGTYRTAEICLNGHASTTSIETSPELRQKFCSSCGEPTQTTCSGCSASIRGDYHVEGVLSLGYGYSPPSFCHNCGTAFPWTNRKIIGAVELADAASKLSPDELAELQRDLNELTKDTPRTLAASVRVKRALSKLGTSVATGIKEITVDVLSEAAKKAIWGG